MPRYVNSMTDSIMRPTLAYLLRLWAERDGERWQWRASLQEIPGGQPTAFGEFDLALQFLRERMKREEARARAPLSDAGASTPFDKE